MAVPVLTDGGVCWLVMDALEHWLAGWLAGWLARVQVPFVIKFLSLFPLFLPSLQDVALVVLDEVHYLGDPGRGSTWEEVVCALPLHCQLLAMSATVRNPEDLGGWITQVGEEWWGLLHRLARVGAWITRCGVHAGAGSRGCGRVCGVRTSGRGCVSSAASYRAEELSLGGP